MGSAHPTSTSRRCCCRMSDEELLLAEDEAKWQSKQARRLARERAEMQPVMLAGQHLQACVCPPPACLTQLSLHCAGP